MNNTQRTMRQRRAKRSYLDKKATVRDTVRVLACGVETRCFGAQRRCLISSPQPISQVIRRRQPARQPQPELLAYIRAIQLAADHRTARLSCGQAARLEGRGAARQPRLASSAVTGQAASAAAASRRRASLDLQVARVASASRPRASSDAADAVLHSSAGRSSQGRLAGTSAPALAY